MPTPARRKRLARRERKTGAARASEIVQKLIHKGVRTEQIAVDIDVHHNSVLRWRDGSTAPHGGHLKALEKLLSERAS